MLHTQTITAAAPLKRFTVALARHGDEVLEAQRLRWNVFVEEQGARIDTPLPGVDCDRFDPHCEHLIVRDRVTDRVVGTYRLLTAARAAAAGGFYSEQEFDLTALEPLRAGMIEMGRSCVHSDYRGGAIIALLWSGLADFLATTRLHTLIGCASLPLADGGHYAASVYAAASKDHSAPHEHRVVPHHPLPLQALDAGRDVTPPPLIKGYLRSGAVVCGAPAWDKDFNTADLFMMLQLDRLEQRHDRHFRRAAAPAAA
jgi:putative hemolysin